MNKPRDTRLTAEARGLWPIVAGTFVLSIFSNLAYFAMPVYMMQVAERAIPSQNVLTLVFLTIIALVVVFFGSLMEGLRARVFQAAGFDIDLRLSKELFDVLGRFPSGQSLILHQTAASDLQALREFVSGPSIPNLMDACFAPLFIILMFLLHPLLGLVSLGVLGLLVLFSLLNQTMTYAPTRRARDASEDTTRMLSALSRAREEARVMGMLPPLEKRWLRRRKTLIGWQSLATSRASLFLGLSRLVRNAQQIVIFGLASWLVLNREMTFGGAIAAMIVMTRGLGPVESVVMNWRQLGSVSLAYRRLNEIFYQVPPETQRVALPRPDGRLAASQVSFKFPGKDSPVLNSVSFSLAPGRVLALVGPSGAGKSTLGRVLAGALKPLRGSVMLGDTDLSHWNPDQLGPYLGYMPQQTEFLPGTVADNISRFTEPSLERDAAVVAAVELVGAQDLVSSFPEGYNTRIGPDEYQLSSGQKQRIALARAVYGGPAVVILDEPNANLDTQGEQALANALASLRRNAVTTVLVTHRMNMLAHCDDVLVLNEGSVHTFGAKEQILRRLPPLAAGALTVVQGDLSKGHA